MREKKRRGEIGRRVEVFRSGVEFGIFTGERSDSALFIPCSWTTHGVWPRSVWQARPFFVLFPKVETSQAMQKKTWLHFLVVSVASVQCDRCLPISHVHLCKVTSRQHDS